MWGNFIALWFCLLLGEVPRFDDAVEEFAAGAELKDEVDVLVILRAAVKGSNMAIHPKPQAGTIAMAKELLYRKSLI